mgnify:CR=1 FL=1
MNIALIAAAAVIGIVVFVTMVIVLNKMTPPAPKPETPRENSRAYRRYPFHSTFEMLWRDSEGRERALKALAFDMSDKGMGVKADRAIETGSLVTVRGGEYNASGMAWVRHCTRRGRSYLVGLEFKEALVRGDAARRHFGSA